MLWSQFSAIFDNFRRSNWHFSQKPMLWSNFCICNVSLFRVKNANFSADFFGKNISKIIASVPGHPALNSSLQSLCLKKLTTGSNCQLCIWRQAQLEIFHDRKLKALEMHWSQIYSLIVEGFVEGICVEQGLAERTFFNAEYLKSILQLLAYICKSDALSQRPRPKTKVKKTNKCKPLFHT
jgi:hypothetical protein